MPYNTNLANQLREYLAQFPKLQIEEKKMFGGVAFMVNGKMCVNVSDDQLMCRFDPDLTPCLEQRPGFMPMVMKGKVLEGYCYVEPDGFKNKSDFEFWVNVCLDYNHNAKSSKKK